MSDLGDLLYGKGWSEMNEKITTTLEEFDKKYPDILEQDDSFVKYIFIDHTKQIFKVLNDGGIIPQKIVKEMEEKVMDILEGRI